MINFNNQRYWQLFETRNSLNSHEQREFLNYCVLLEQEIYWQNQYKYRSLISDFNRSIISCNEFIKQFETLRRETFQAVDWLETYLGQNKIYFKLTFYLEGFVPILDELYERIDAYESDLKGFVLTTECMSQEGLKYYVQSICYPKIEEYCDNEEIAYQNFRSQELQERMEQNLAPYDPEVSEIKFYDYEEILELLETNSLVTNNTTNWNDNQVLNEMLIFFILISSLTYFWLKTGLLGEIFEVH